MLLPVTGNTRLTNGDAIKTRRVQRGLSQRDLAKLISITAVSLSNIEHGKQEVSVRTLWALSRALTVPMEALLTAPHELAS